MPHFTDVGPSSSARLLGKSTGPKCTRKSNPPTASHRSTSATECQASLPPGSVMQTIIPGRLSLVFHKTDFRSFLASIERTKMKGHHFFTSTLHDLYTPFGSDFGPVNLGVVVQFCDFMKKKFAKPLLSKHHLVYACHTNVKSATNGCFLLACFLCAQLQWSVDDAVRPFTGGAAGRVVRAFRDATFGPCSFELTITDCVRGMAKAMEKKWLDVEAFSVVDYLRWDCPKHGDMHRVCPKFIAFKSPVREKTKTKQESEEEEGKEQETQGGERDSDGAEREGGEKNRNGQEEEQEEGEEKGAAYTPETGIPCHSASYYAALFQAAGVSAVIRLTEADSYDANAFTAAGIRVYELFFADCTAPDPSLLTKFIAIVDSEPGPVAVHCLAGLGRTGTLIGGWLMRRHGFSAREAIGWLRLCRPGSVIGPQQHFLEQLETKAAATVTDPTGPFLSCSAVSSSEERPLSLASARDLSGEMMDGMQRQWEGRVHAGRPSPQSDHHG